MPDLSIQLLVAMMTAVPFVLLYWAGRFVSRRRLGAALRQPRTLQGETLRRWVERGWLDPEGAGRLPARLSAVDVFYEWAWADPKVPLRWRLRAPAPAAGVEEMVAGAWDRLPEADRVQARERLAQAVTEASTWWGGAERGWNRRPLAVPADAVPKKAQALPLLPLPDLTAAPAPPPVSAGAHLREAEGPDLVLLLAVLRRADPEFTHPLAPEQDQVGSLIAGLSHRAATDVGARIGAGLGAALGPIGAMLGRRLGEMAGALGGKALAEQALPPRIGEPLRQTEAALSHLGRLVQGESLEEAARAPAEAVLAFGRKVEPVRESRSRGVRERIWPTAGLVLVEEVLRRALAELEAYRGAADHFVAAARKAPEAVAGGMLLQNPWMVRSLPTGPAHLNAARAALNRAAKALRLER
jgi:hypothetical protein